MSLINQLHLSHVEAKLGVLAHLLLYLQLRLLKHPQKSHQGAIVFLRLMLLGLSLSLERLFTLCVAHLDCQR